jgi:8-oxo-dGTP pyrophosphatase MutT (NUDIX family)
VTGDRRRADLITLLASYVPVDDDERAYRLRMLDLAAASLDPFSRHEHTPGHFTVSGFVVHPAGDRILLVHHERLGIWVQPGGHVEPGDPGLLHAARREITEETGLEALRPITPGLIDVDVHEFPASADLPGHLHFDLRFGFVSAHEVARALDGALEVRWVADSELAELGVDRSVTRPANKLLG